MKFWRTRERPAPQGVRILKVGGGEVPCLVLRDPDGDKHGCALWLAVPQADYTFTPGDELQVDMLPGRTGIEVRMTLNPESR